MFFEKRYTYGIIDNSITNKELQQFLREHNVFMDIVDDSTEWAAFAQYYGHKYGLDEFAAASFSHIISTVFADVGVSAGTEYYFKENSIFDEVVKYWNKLGVIKYEDEETKAIRLFNHILKLYVEKLDDFEYKTQNLNIRLSERNMYKFDQVPGENKTEKFNTLLKFYIENNSL